MRATALTATVLTATAILACGYAPWAAAGDKSLANGAAAMSSWQQKTTLLSVPPAQTVNDEILKPSAVNINIPVGFHALSVESAAPATIARMLSLANAAGRVALGDVAVPATQVELRAHGSDYADRSDVRSRLVPQQ